MRLSLFAAVIFAEKMGKHAEKAAVLNNDEPLAVQKAEKALTHLPLTV